MEQGPFVHSVAMKDGKHHQQATQRVPLLLAMFEKERFGVRRALAGSSRRPVTSVGGLRADLGASRWTSATRGSLELVLDHARGSTGW